MEVDIIPDGVSEDDSFIVDQINDEFSAFEGERCGICMDLVIDRGVLDCCQHWFCFTCIDNWATITNLCPLCQNEFQSITCVPVYDTIGSNKVEEDSFSREEDWCIEGKNNTLSFPSYYIDENAVICLDGDGCKLRSGSVKIEEDSNLDTSIACDSCDIWYHAFCVGFDPEGTCEGSWLCPRCLANINPTKSNSTSVLGPSNQCHTENAIRKCLLEDAFSGKVSVSVADAGETAVVVSMVEESQVTEGPRAELSSTSEVDKDPKMEMLICSSDANATNQPTPWTEDTSIQPALDTKELQLCLSQYTSFSLPCISLGESQVKTISADKPKKEPSGSGGSITSSRKFLNNSCSANEPCQSGLDLHLGLSVGAPLSVDSMKNDASDSMKNDAGEDQEAGEMQERSCSEECLLPAGKIVNDLKDDVLAVSGRKRKLRHHSDDVHTVAEDEETKDKIQTKASVKKVKAVRNNQVIDSKDEADKFVTDESWICNKGKENAASEIMSIVQGTDRKPFKSHRLNNHTDNSLKERENATGLRMKKIMRRAGEDKESSMLVQNLRKEIREAVRNKSSEELGENLFDPKLLAAFRAVFTGSITEPAQKSPALVVKAKKLMLQKGKVRESLTKKIYGIGGRRKKAWTRDCEVEFWKHRCLRAGRPEKIETLKSVLNLLRKNSDGSEIRQRNDGKATTSILSRLYIADTSVFPRKDDIKPLADLKATAPAKNNAESLREKLTNPSLENHDSRNLQKNSSQVGASAPNNKGNRNTAVTSVKGEAASSQVHPSGSKSNTEKETIGKPNDIKKDKRKWALEVLARKSVASSGKASQEKLEGDAVLKRNYPLLAQLPIDMRPVLSPSRHNKIPVSVRQAQLYRLTEHFLRKANLPVIRRTADTELAVADAVNIEKEVSDRSNSKLVYVNLMSQELLHRSDNSKSSRSTESAPSSTLIAADIPEQVTSDLCDGPMVEEALKNAGLLSDSPPNSPYCKMEETNEQNEHTESIVGEETDNVFQINSHPELDIYGDFEYDLEDEDLVVGSGVKIFRLQEEESKMKLVFSTLNAEKSNDALDSGSHERTTAVEEPKASFCLHEHETHENTGNSSMEARIDDCLHQDPITDEGGEEPSLAECEELYGPDKEPLVKRFPASTLIKPYEPINSVVPEQIEHSGSSQTVKASELGTESCAEKTVVKRVDLHASGGENAANSRTNDKLPRKEKLSNTNSKKQSDSSNSVLKKVEAYIKEHIRPLCKSGVVTVEQYRWAVGKTTDKVMKYHSKEKTATFLIKEGEKVKKLAEQYVEASQQMERK